MARTKRGFTLIELLIVVAIIGLLAALFIPNALTAIQKSKQKTTMKNIFNISTAIADYITDHGRAPTQDGTYDGSSTFYDSISTFYIKVLPLTDEWGTGIRVWCGSAATQYGISSPLQEDYIVSSYGRDRAQEDFTFDFNAPEDGLYEVLSLSDFDKDLVAYNGNWIRYPRAALGGSS
ncbi:MAG: prepilin-type N-terminal cleavage/methylation domain-containing protein [Candidatus Aminicenantes bacterium]|nr:prepilin-type N-terminal cleavage/methylation domain-containing protein [Candidatus Aminicenantes bacterium]